MAPQILQSLSEHAVFLLLVQLALLLAVARLGAELCKRFGLPGVVGELLAGIALGPSLLGHFAPGAFAAIFPPDAAQFQLLEVVGTLGMVLLLLFTGLETDLKLLRHLGRAALIASAMGMVVPFAMGFVLGLVMPDAYLAQPGQRILFSAFLATAMAISAMPVIAKILADLDLTKRNIGLVILSAGVVDDTAGWLILSLIAGAAHGEIRLARLLGTLGLTVGFVAAAALVLLPLARWLVAQTTRRGKTRDADLVLLLVVTLLCAALTQWIGVHAGFGAFVAGTVFRQVPQLRADAVHRLEALIMAVLAPVFFGLVGLKVDLWALGGGTMLLVVLTVACLGKLVGCTLGSIWGGLRFWEGLSIAVAMNARGAMELVVATIGLSLGILNPQMFAIIVVVAIATSFLAPVGLRLTMRKVRLTEDESRRMLAEQVQGVFDPTRVRVLLAVDDGANTLAAATLAAGLAKRSAHPVEVLHVKRPRSWRQWLRELAARPRTPGLERVSTRQHLMMAGLSPAVRHVKHADVAGAIAEVAGRGFELVVVGASWRGESLGGPVLADLVRAAPCHLAIVKAGPNEAPYRRLLVPFDGGVFARVAVEFAVRYAEVTGASLTVALLTEQRPQIAAYADPEHTLVSASSPTSDDDRDRISRIFRTTELRPTIEQLAYGPSSSNLREAIASGKHDLVVIGAENRALQHRLYFGYDNERILSESRIAAVVVVPHVALLR
ncbi:MAG: cation:proton antiporter [Proteobacteria bacterium]|nr:cation:proton antiporter [Pseudomonadota bacterium]